MAEHDYVIKKSDKIYINYKLTAEQERISDEILQNFKKKKNQLINAVCGAGKTELVFKVIEYALKNKKRVGFAIPRKDVVIELSIRLQNAFQDAKVVAIYGGSTNVLEGDILVLTTHQLYRYEKYFDLLILDEIDAFPFKDNDVLYQLFLRSVKGNYVLMSATASKKFIQNLEKNKVQILNLFVRYHYKPIPVPKIYVVPLFIFKMIFLIFKLKKFIKEGKPVLVFVPTIDLSKKLYIFIKNFVKPGYFLNSTILDRQQIIDDFRNKIYKYLITTSVLERGVTLENLQVIIYKADSNIYNEAALTQISGRVGRKKNFTSGEVIFLGDKKTNEMEKSINRIVEANKNLQKLLL